MPGEIAHTPCSLCCCTRHNKTLTQLLGRCARVQHAIGQADDDENDGDALHDEIRQQQAAALNAQQGARASLQDSQGKTAAAGRLRVSDSR
jgi:hypothetical protein